MKSHRIITSVAVIMALLLTAINVQAQRILPLTVKQFLDEQAFTNHLPPPVRSTYHFSQFFPPRMIDGQEMVDAFIAVDDMSAIDKLQQAGVVVNCCFEGFVTAQIPVDDLIGICEMPCVRDIEISRKMTLCTDSTLNVTHAGQVLDGINNGLPQSYDGTGVIIATLDVGYDYQHLAFRRSDNPAVTRIKRVYSTTGQDTLPALTTTSACQDQCSSMTRFMPSRLITKRQVTALTLPALPRAPMWVPMAAWRLMLIS